MSSLAEVKPRNVLKVTVVAMIVAMLVSNISVFAIPAVLGWSKVRKGNPPIDLEGIAMGNFWNRPYLGPLTDVSGYLIAGFLFMVVTRLLYARFLWVPNPIMAIVAWSWTTSLHGAWSAFLVAWVIKYTVLKIGGSKLYEERVVPMVGGFMIGSIVEVLLATLLSFAVIPR